ncbi:hypothetical protein M407DRAFT_34517 [Tulasnella calospora MUT 4182]|uniref:Uncharacterized protein n=1 Tax=Tulasnella calospora MUT 4182 TaxID=1051891 RepID=A0A0C3Q168_9AGAM|nr:hypothetical protein M407DRAFT_34517 [Tulasnella calospora MUT 4182]
MAPSEGSTVRGARGVEQRNVTHVDFLCKALRLEEMQAKLRQRAHDVSELGLNASPQMKAQMTVLCDKLASGLRQHYETLAEVAPQLMNSGHQVLPDAPHADEILLPSRLTPDQVDNMSLRELLELEVQLRVIHAYDAIASLKKALAMRSFWTRHFKAQYSSQGKRTKGQASLRSCQARVKEASRAYSACYEWLTKSAPEVAENFGLQKLCNRDLMLLSEYLEQQHYRQNGRRLSWIWTLRPKFSAADDVDESPDSLKAVVESWQNEFTRLEYVHARAAVDRWTEEVKILECEMPAVVRWFEKEAMRWSCMSSGQGDDAGFRAYTCRQFSLYQTLADHALEVFTAVTGGEEAWDSIWDNPKIGNDDEGSAPMDVDNGT